MFYAVIAMQTARIETVSNNNQSIIRMVLVRY